MTNDVVTLYAYDWQRAESYGRIAHELADGLEAKGLHVNRIGPHAPTDRPVRMSFGGIGLGYPTNTDYYGSLFEMGPRIWVTAFESTRIPWGWADILNQSQGAIVPSSWLVDVFKNEGVDVPVHCVHQGVSAVYRPVTRESGRPYTFLLLADRAERKGFKEGCFAFMRAFGDDPNYRLIVKARKGYPIHFANPNVDTRSADYSDDEMLALYAEADCMIFPGREGFGLPPREFAATGGTAIALNWGGTADHLPQWGLPIAVKGMEPAWATHSRFAGMGEWGAIDVDDLAATLKHVAAHRDYYRQRSIASAAFATQTYDWSLYASRVLAIWQEAVESYGRSHRQLRQAV